MARGGWARLGGAGEVRPAILLHTFGQPAPPRHVCVRRTVLLRSTLSVWPAQAVVGSRARVDHSSCTARLHLARSRHCVQRQTRCSM